MRNIEFDESVHALNCETCSGNGEIIVDWELYMAGTDDEAATQDCPDCYGTGSREFADALEAGCREWSQSDAG